MRTKTKPRIALLAMGVLSESKSSLGIPVLIDLFNRLSNDFEIVCYSFNPIERSSVSGTIQVRSIVRWPIPGRLKFLLLSARLIWDHIFRPYQLLFAISVFPPGLWALRIARLIRRKLAVQIIALEVVALPDIQAGYLLSPWHRKVTTRVCEETDALIAVADYQRKVAIESLPTHREIEVLPLRINPEKFHYKEREISFPVEFIHIAYYSPIKDQVTMFKSFAAVARQVDCHLTVIGAGYDVPEVTELLESLNILDKVKFTGIVPQAELPPHFNDKHILLHTARFETGCAVIQEAMASGVAVGGTNVGILSDIGDQYAVIVPQQAADLLAEKILQLISDRDHYKNMTRRAYEWIRAYDAEWSYKNYKAFLEGMIK